MGAGNKKKDGGKKEAKGVRKELSDKWEVTQAHAASTSMENDGINGIGRVGIIFGTVSLILYLLAMISPTWSIVENLGSGAFATSQPFFNRVSRAEFGMYRFCLYTTIPEMMDAEHKICYYNYKTAIFQLQGDVPLDENGVKNCAPLKAVGGACYNDELCTCDPETGLVTSKERNAYDHFEAFNLKARRANVEWVVLGVLITMVIADVLSHILILNSILCALGALGGVACLVLWSKIAKDIDFVTDGVAEQGIGFTFLCAGFGTAFAASIFCAIDICKYPEMERFGFLNDGTSYFGRLGALLGCLVWVLFTASILYPQWAKTDLLEDGFSGFSYKDPEHPGKGLEEVTGALFGLWDYCLELPADAFVGVQMVCMQTSDQIQLRSLGEDEDGFIRSQSGCDIFESVGYCKRNEIIVVCLLIAISMAFVADVFSEKLLANGISMFVCFLLGAAACVQWLIFKINITGPKSYGAASAVDVGVGFFIALIGMGAALVSGLLLYLDYRDIGECSNSFKEGKSVHDDGSCLGACLICTGTGTSGYDNSDKSLEETRRVESRA